MRVGLSGRPAVPALGANDPQIQAAEDAAAILAAGETPVSVLPADKVYISTSLAPFAIIYSTVGTPLVSSGFLHGATPLLLSGVFDYTRQNGEDRITRQPEPGVQIAVVVFAYEGSQPGFFLVGVRCVKLKNASARLGE